MVETNASCSNEGYGLVYAIYQVSAATSEADMSKLKLM